MKRAPGRLIYQYCLYLIENYGTLKYDTFFYILLISNICTLLDIFMGRIFQQFLVYFAIIIPM